MQTEVGLATSQNILNDICKGNTVLERVVSDNRPLFEPYMDNIGLNGSKLPIYRKCIQVARLNGIKDKVAKYMLAIKDGLDTKNEYESLFVEKYNSQADNFLREYILENSTPPDYLEQLVKDLNGGNALILINII